MEVQANYIKRIVIHGLWHRYDIAWDLRPDVNILSGINGVGKTTILNRSVNYLEQTSGEVKNDEKNGVHVFLIIRRLLSYRTMSFVAMTVRSLWGILRPVWPIRK